MSSAVVIRKKVSRQADAGQSPLPATIVVLHGWGYDSRCMESLEGLLSRWADVWFLDLHYNNQSLDSLLTDLNTILPQQSFLIGWSLGAMLATKLASNQSLSSDKSVIGMISLSANAIFVANDSWPHAMPPKTFAQFLEGVEVNLEKQMKRFNQLVAFGDNNKKDQLAWLNSTVVMQEALMTGLNLLKAINNIEAFESLAIPHLVLFGKNDALVPSTCVEDFKAYHCEVKMLENRGHCLHYPVDDISPMIETFLEQFCSDR